MTAVGTVATVKRPTVLVVVVLARWIELRVVVVAVVVEVVEVVEVVVVAMVVVVVEVAAVAIVVVMMMMMIVPRTADYHCCIYCTRGDAGSS